MLTFVKKLKSIQISYGFIKAQGSSIGSFLAHAYNCKCFVTMLGSCNVVLK